METDEYCVEKVSFYQLNLLRLDVVMTLIYSQYLAPFLSSGRFVDGAHKYDYLQSEWELKKQIEEEFRVDVKNFFRLPRTHLVNLVP